MLRSNRSSRSGQTVARPAAPARRPGAANVKEASSNESGPEMKAATGDSTESAKLMRNKRIQRRRLRGTAARRGSADRAPERENGALVEYENSIKASFDDIVPVLKEIAALQHESDFERRAQQIAREKFGFELPEAILADAWVSQLDMKRLFAWCVFQTYRAYCDDFYRNNPLALDSAEGFQVFLQECGFHTLDITPCADGRLAHVIRYVLRLPQDGVRRKSYAGAMFDVENSIAKWTEVEMRRFREGVPNNAEEPTRYLKTVVYHYSSVDPLHQGCAAHGSDNDKAASSGLERLEAFRTAVENSFCCGASIDLLLIGLDTDTDAIRVHLPDASSHIDLNNAVDAMDLDSDSRSGTVRESDIDARLREVWPDAADGMVRFAARLLRNNLAQVEYVRQYHDGEYQDTGHAERFIGAGVGFEEVQLRNLMYFAYLNTVEEATADTDVGIKIFTGLNVNHGLPVPVVVRYDYHGQVPGARERAEAHCARVSDAFHARYADLSANGLLHTLQVVRDVDGNDSIERLRCSVMPEQQEAH